MKRLDGTNIDSPEELLEEWKKHFKTLLNADPTPPASINSITPANKDLPIKIDPISIEETRAAILDLRNGKSPGCDYAVTPEALKYGGEEVIKIIHEIINHVYVHEKAPTQFTTSLIVHLPKKGDLSQMGNYRGISLL